MNAATAVCLTAVIGGSASLALGLVVTRTFSRRASLCIKTMTPHTSKNSASLLIASSSSSSSSSWQEMTVAELKLQLKEQGLPVSGTKAMLIQRLESIHQSSEQSAALMPTVISSKKKSKYFTTTTNTEPTTSVLPMTPSMKRSSPSTVTPEGKKITSSKYFNATKRGSSPTSKGESSTTTSPRKRIKIEPGSLSPPHDWERIYNLVKELRVDKTAPCDIDGGEALPEKHLGQKVYRYQVLTALMLSSQTKDAIVGEAMRGLQKHGLTVENIHSTEDTILNQLIGRVGFHNNKTKYIKQVAEILVLQYNGDIPRTADEMIALPGVGPKMAYIVESIVYGTSSGIGVDTHMHRML
jgi:endonuclease-3